MSCIASIHSADSIFISKNSVITTFSEATRHLRVAYHCGTRLAAVADDGPRSKGHPEERHWVGCFDGDGFR
jgi:hypothetical protein